MAKRSGTRQDCTMSLCQALAAFLLVKIKLISFILCNVLTSFFIGVDVTVGLNVSPDKFVIQNLKDTDKEKYQLVFQNMRIMAPYHTLSDEAYDNLYGRLKKEPLLINYRKIVSRKFILAEKVSDFITENLCLSKVLPLRLWIVFIKSSSFKGDYKHSPFKFDYKWEVLDTASLQANHPTDFYAPPSIFGAPPSTFGPPSVISERYQAQEPASESSWNPDPSEDEDETDEESLSDIEKDIEELKRFMKGVRQKKNQRNRQRRFEKMEQINNSLIREEQIQDQILRIYRDLPSTSREPKDVPSKRKFSSTLASFFTRRRSLPDRDQITDEHRKKLDDLKKLEGELSRVRAERMRLIHRREEITSESEAEESQILRKMEEKKRAFKRKNKKSKKDRKSKKKKKKLQSPSLSPSLSPSIQSPFFP